MSQQQQNVSNGNVLKNPARVISGKDLENFKNPTHLQAALSHGYELSKLAQGLVKTRPELQ